MSTIRVACGNCKNDVDLQPDDVRLIINPDSDGRRGQYEFTCEKCGMEQAKPADKKIIMLLMAAGVEVVDPEPATPAGPPPFTDDDSIEFHFVLEDDEALESWLAGS